MRPAEGLAQVQSAAEKNIGPLYIRYSPRAWQFHKSMHAFKGELGGLREFSLLPPSHLLERSCSNGRLLFVCRNPHK